MSEQPAGRARGRGRARGDVPSSGAVAAPASVPVAAPVHVPVSAPAPAPGVVPPQGRGRGRGGNGHTGPAVPGPAAPSPQPPQPQPPTDAGRGRGRGVAPTGLEEDMAKLHVGSGSQPPTNGRGATAGGARGDRPAGPRDGTRGGVSRRLKYAIIEQNVRPENVVEKHGSAGRKVNLLTNYVRFSKLPRGKFYVYDVNLREFRKSHKDKILLLNQMMDQGLLPNGAVAYDGRRAYTSTKWTEEDVATVQFQGKNVSFRKVDECLEDTEQYYQMINIIFQNAQVLMGQQRIGRSYFISPNATPAGGGAKGVGWKPNVSQIDNFHLLWGFEIAVQRGSEGNNQPIPIAHVDKINRILNIGTVLDAVRSPESMQELMGRTVMTKYNNRTYQINDFDLNLTLDSLFTTADADGTEHQISFRKYFADRHGIQLQQTKQPFVVSRPRRRDVQRRQRGERGVAQEGGEAPQPDTILLPSEVCYLTGFSEREKRDYQRNRQFNDMTKRLPGDRKNDIGHFHQWVDSEGSTRRLLKTWDLEFSAQSLPIEGRELPPVQIVCSNPRDPDSRKVHTSELRVNNGEWDVRNIRLAPAKPTNEPVKVGVLYRHPMNYQGFLRNLKRVGDGMNFIMNEVGGDDIQPYNASQARDIGRLLSEFQQMEYDIVLCMGLREGDYTAIKTCSVDTGLVTQCITKRNAEDERKGPSIATKVALQMACKLGCDAWSVKNSMGVTMFVGMDTFHSKSKNVSVHASVFTINKFYTQYVSLANKSDGRAEFQNFITSHFTTALETFALQNRRCPDRIVVFRDGVSDSQLSAMKEQEVGEMKKAIGTWYENAGKPFPRFTVVVVKKRIATRYYTERDNPAPGTVVDKTIVKPNFLEFFLVSQFTRQGTVTPTNYNVIEDNPPDSEKERGLNPLDYIQSATYAMSHLYFNWPGTIRVPAPVHYAHRLAFLVGQSIPTFRDLHVNVRTKLWYL